MTSSIRSLFLFFDNVLHPAGGWSENGPAKKRSLKPSSALPPSPDCFNIRAGAKKNDKTRRNPAP